MSVEASLARLRELALALPRPGCDWEERPRFDPPPTPDAISAFETAAGFQLPADLRRFFADTDAAIGMSFHNGYWIGGVERLVDFITYDVCSRSVEGEPAAAIATDGGGNAFLLSASGRVWRWNHETGAVSPVAESFGAFLDRVVADWEAYAADTPGWRFLG